MIQSHLAACKVKKKIHLPKAFKVTSPPILQEVSQVLAAKLPARCGGGCGHPGRGANRPI